MVGFESFAMDLSHAFHQGAQMGHAASRPHALLRLAAVGEKSDAVARIERDLREAQSCIHSVVELGQAIHARPQQTARVEHKPQGLASLDLVNLGDQLSAPRGCAPTDIAEFVAFAKIAQTLEFAALPPLALQPLFKLDLPAADQVDAQLLRLFDIGVDTHGLSETRSRPSLGNAQRTLITQPGIAEMRVAARAGLDCVRSAAGAICRRRDFDAWKIATQSLRSFVVHSGGNRGSR